MAEPYVRLRKENLNNLPSVQGVQPVDKTSIGKALQTVGEGVQKLTTSALAVADDYADETIRKQLIQADMDATQADSDILHNTEKDEDGVPKGLLLKQGIHAVNTPDTYKKYRLENRSVLSKGMSTLAKEKFFATYDRNTAATFDSLSNHAATEDVKYQSQLESGRFSANSLNNGMSAFTQKQNIDANYTQTLDALKQNLSSSEIAIYSTVKPDAKGKYTPEQTAIIEKHKAEVNQTFLEKKTQAEQNRQNGIMSIVDSWKKGNEENATKYIAFGLAAGMPKEKMELDMVSFEQKQAQDLIAVFSSNGDFDTVDTLLSDPSSIGLNDPSVIEKMRYDNTSRRAMMQTKQDYAIKKAQKQEETAYFSEYQKQVRENGDWSPDEQIDWATRNMPSNPEKAIAIIEKAQADKKAEKKEVSTDVSEAVATLLSNGVILDSATKTARTIPPDEILSYAQQANLSGNMTKADYHAVIAKTNQKVGENRKAFINMVVDNDLPQFIDSFVASEREGVAIEYKAQTKTVAGVKTPVNKLSEEVKNIERKYIDPSRKGFFNKEGIVHEHLLVKQIVEAMNTNARLAELNGWSPEQAYKNFKADVQPLQNELTKKRFDDTMTEKNDTILRMSKMYQSKSIPKTLFNSGDRK